MQRFAAQQESAPPLPIPSAEQHHQRRAQPGDRAGRSQGQPSPRKPGAYDDARRQSHESEQQKRPWRHGFTSGLEASANAASTASTA